MTGRNILAIDLGTTAVKCALYSTSGVEVASATQEYELQTTAPGHVEVDVEVYWKSIRDCLADIWRKAGDRRGEVASLAISAQGETLVPVDASGNALCPAIVWLDNRANQESFELADRFPAAELYARTGQPAMLATWPAAKSYCGLPVISPTSRNARRAICSSRITCSPA